MKTTQECWQALIDGEMLIYKGDKSRIVKLEDQSLVWRTGQTAKVALCYPEDWSIYTPPKWFNNIPEHGVPCWADTRLGILPDFIISYCKGDKYPFIGMRDSYKSVQPLTKQEIQTLLDNVPEGGTE